MGKDQATTVTFKFKNETKGAIRYQEIGDDGVERSTGDGAKIGSLYIRKTALNGDGVPQKLKVVITPA